jgi:peptidoglycan/LPS O-acetylase OafA/YrhL
VEEKTQKIWFLQLTRVLACLLVVYVHWYGILATPNVIHNLLSLDELPNYPKVNLVDYVQIFIGYLHIKYFTGAYFSVGLFFILSGYVIPMSLKNSKPYDFLIRRILRIYPTLIVCLVIAASTMTFANLYLVSSEPSHFFSLSRLVGNMLLIRDLMHASYIEYATWTLEIEIHFYLLFFLFFYFAIEKKIFTFIASSFVLLFLGRSLFYLGHLVGDHEKILGLAKLIAINGNYLSYMFVGTALYYVTSKEWTYTKGILTLLFLLGLNYICLLTDRAITVTAPLIFLNHVYALVLFIMFYFVNNYIPYSKLLNKIAEFSYPLYLIHGFTGYTLYFLLFNATHNVVLSGIVAFSLVIAIALLVHYLVEQPSISYSKKIIKNQAPLLKLPRFLKKKIFEPTKV